MTNLHAETVVVETSARGNASGREQADGSTGYRVRQFPRRVGHPFGTSSNERTAVGRTSRLRRFTAASASAGCETHRAWDLIALP